MADPRSGSHARAVDARFDTGALRADLPMRAWAAPVRGELTAAARYLARLPRPG